MGDNVDEGVVPPWTGSGVTGDVGWLVGAEIWPALIVVDGLGEIGPLSLTLMLLACLLTGEKRRRPESAARRRFARCDVRSPRSTAMAPARRQPLLSVCAPACVPICVETRRSANQLASSCLPTAILTRLMCLRVGGGSEAMVRSFAIDAVFRASVHAHAHHGRSLASLDQGL